jgi:hypothetical protein
VVLLQVFDGTKRAEEAVSPHKVNNCCQCPFCAWNKLPLPYILEAVDDVNNAMMDDVNDVIDFGTDGDPDGDCINDSWLTEPVTCASKAEELAPHITLALFLKATPTPNSPVKISTSTLPTKMNFGCTHPKTQLFGPFNEI